jgi:hypothetical protein
MADVLRDFAVTEREACQGCGKVPMVPHFRALPPVGVTGAGQAWCDECILAGKSNLDASLVDYVKKIHGVV